VELDPIAVALKFGFLAVLYLFLLWVARSSLRDLRRGAGEDAGPAYAPVPAPDATGFHQAAEPFAAGDARMPKLRVNSAPGLRAGAAYDLTDGAVLGRSPQADIQLEDNFASTRHARLVPSGDVMVLEDLGSTNGTYLNDEPLRGAAPLHEGDRIRIGDSEFRFER
jgi:hypothetical protein